MAETLVKGPRVHEPGLAARLRAGLRYQGGVGQRTWLLHRITGIGIALFLLIHIVDTFIVVAYPRLYDHTVSIYGGVFNGAYFWPLRWGFRVGELALIACVVFHAFNGVRLIIFDFWPRMSEHRLAITAAVMMAFWAVMVPVTIWVLIPLASTPQHWQMPPAEDVPALVSGESALPG